MRHPALRALEIGNARSLPRKEPSAMAEALPGSDTSRSQVSTGERPWIDRPLILAAALLMAYGALWPIFGRSIARDGQFAVLAAVTVAMAGGWAAPRGSRLSFKLLWAALGMACALGIIGIFSVGVVFLAAAVLIALAIFATPNRSGLAVRFDWRFIAAFYTGFLVVFLPILFLLLRDRANYRPRLRRGCEPAPFGKG
jgi:hypothetical protein